MSKRIVVASDSFKGTLSSLKICSLFENELKDRDLSLCSLAIADGGEGSLEAISRSKKGHFVEVVVNDLYFHKIKTKFFVDEEDNVFIEAASTVGLSLANKDNDPGTVTSFGLGEQIKNAIELDYKNIYVFLGGTASNDGGAGLASALGTKFYNENSERFTPVGLTLKNIAKVDNKETDELLKNINIVVLSDVKSPFYGEEGAAYKFAAQKGATKDEIIALDGGLKHLSEIANIPNVPGAGAAGGLGGSLLAFAHAKIESGIDAILDLIHFNEAIKTADVVITGEGKLDKQTLDGKVIDGVAKRCQLFNKDLIIIVGISELSLKEIQDIYPNVIGLYETNPKHLPFEEIKANAEQDYIKIIKSLKI